jgi:uncharacterized membrane protein required for colicin V production
MNIQQLRNIAEILIVFFIAYIISVYYVEYIEPKIKRCLSNFIDKFF